MKYVYIQSLVEKSISKRTIVSRRTWECYENGY